MVPFSDSSQSGANDGDVCKDQSLALVILLGDVSVEINADAVPGEIRHGGRPVGTCHGLRYGWGFDRAKRLDALINFNLSLPLNHHRFRFQLPLADSMSTMDLCEVWISTSRNR